jgi:hypothetical protein
VDLSVATVKARRCFKTNCRFVEPATFLNFVVARDEIVATVSCQRQRDSVATDVNRLALVFEVMCFLL